MVKACVRLQTLHPFVCTCNNVYKTKITLRCPLKQKSFNYSHPVILKINKYITVHSRLKCKVIYQIFFSRCFQGNAIQQL